MGPCTDDPISCRGPTLQHHEGVKFPRIHHKMTKVQHSNSGTFQPPRRLLVFWVWRLHSAAPEHQLPAPGMPLSWHGQVKTPEEKVLSPCRQTDDE